MASSLTTRHPASSLPSGPANPADEEYLNRSLLDNIEAQAESEPTSSSDSEAPGGSAGTYNSLSMGSPSVPYHFSMQSQLQPQRSESPNSNILSNHVKPTHHSADHFAQGPQNNTTHTMYNSSNGIGLSAPDYSSNMTSPEADAYNYSSSGPFGSPPFRPSATFASFPNRLRNPSAPFRDTSSNFNLPAFIPSLDTYPPIPSSQSQPLHSFDSAHQFGRGYDQSLGVSQANGSSQAKQLSYGAESFRQGLDSSAASLLSPHALKQQHGNSNVSMLLPNGQPQTQGAQQQFAGYMNGLASLGQGHHAQTQYGPHLPSNGTAAGVGIGAPGGAISGGHAVHPNGASQSSQQEEISTIFVVGFPDDMQEREFQNMFTFSSGFEAATLKIPNKELTSYGSTGAPGATSRMSFAGQNDPYNLVTMNQGGVLIDGGRDGPLTSWPASTALSSTDDSHFLQNQQAPRKQIIGFAKFRTKQDALEARDVLQGRRIDIEKGAVLKAEMAKKNLHTKRGPGVPLGSVGSSGAGTTDGPNSFSGVNGYSNMSGAGEALAQREKQLGALGAMGIDLSGLGQRRDRIMDDGDRPRTDLTLMGLGMLGTRGPRERAEDEERERERKRKEKEREVMRLRQNSFAFEAFHSVPQQMVRQGANSLLAAESGAGPNGMGHPSSPPLQSISSQSEMPWSSLRDVSASAALRKLGPQQSLGSITSHRTTSPSSLQTSPPSSEAIANLAAFAQNGHAFGAFSQEFVQGALPGHPSLPSRPRPFSPSGEVNGTGMPASSSMPTSSASSASGSQIGQDDELLRSLGVLAVSAEPGSTSPQLPSPASGASSGRTGSDQNPPINTLYVGNLPSSASPGGYTLNYLEDRLRDLFSKQSGYRKLCFRQKSNGPMCFVEFENVEFATTALNQLYGNTLNGMIKNGIRLSYSKNPLGVRTPNSGGSGPSLQQQQQFMQGPGQTPVESYPRHSDSAETIQELRREPSTHMSPTSSYHYTTSPPPPRFFSPPPPSGSFASMLTSSTAFPRANPQGFGVAVRSTTSFSPFGISHSIPDQPSADHSNDHLAHSIPPAAANVEAGRAG